MFECLIPPLLIPVLKIRPPPHPVFFWTFDLIFLLPTEIPCAPSLDGIVAIAGL